MLLLELPTKHLGWCKVSSPAYVTKLFAPEPALHPAVMHPAMLLLPLPLMLAGD
jgi:hypothetical protein